MENLTQASINSILQIAIAVIAIFFAVKVFKNLSKWVVALIVIAGCVLMLKGIIDWAMIVTAGEDLLDWLKSQFNSVSSDAKAESSSEILNLVFKINY